MSVADRPLSGDPASTPRRLSFPAPLRLILRGALLNSPDFPGIVGSALRRVAGLAGESRGEGCRSLMRSVFQEAARIEACRWRGERVDLVHWSGARQREIGLYGVVGSLLLPNGPGRLWPLFATNRWTHVGKGTVLGVGELNVTAIEESRADRWH